VDRKKVLVCATSRGAHSTAHTRLDSKLKPTPLIPYSIYQFPFSHCFSYNFLPQITEKH